jgi:hypothetical protein
MKIHNIQFVRPVLLVCLFSCLFACEKLNEEPKTFVTPESFGNSVAQIETAFVGSMDCLWSYWGGYGWGYPDFLNDDQFQDGGLIIENDFGSDLWDAHYKSLANINNALAAIKNGNIKGATQEEVDLLIGQAKFIRGFNYFYLVRMFGPVPLITEDTPDPKVILPVRASITDVYDLIISDFQDAIAKLPESWDDAPGRPTQGAAKGFLAKVYLTMATAPLNDVSKYALARDMAMEVITSDHYSLIPDVYELFRNENKYSGEMMFSFISTSDDIGTEPQIWSPAEYLDQSGWDGNPVEPAFAESWPDQPRKDAYLMTDLDGVHYTDFGQQAPFCKKFFYYLPESEYTGMASTANMPMLRYADVLLIYAEAANMAGGSPSQAACDAINQVIDRANGHALNANHPLLTTAMTQQEFDDAVIQERSWELCFEYDRWFDICRKRILDKVCRTDELPEFQESDYLFPIPDKDLRINPGLGQNPGYSMP